MPMLLDQYLTEPPLQQQCVSVSCAYLDPDILVHSSWGNCSGFVRLDGRRWQISKRRFQVSPYILHVGLCTGHSNTFSFLFLNHSSIALAGCLEFLSCWKAKRCLVSCRMKHFFFPGLTSVLPSTLTHFPVPVFKLLSHTTKLSYSFSRS